MPATEMAMIKMTPAMKEHIATWAAQRRRTLSDVVREAVCAMTGYDIQGDAALDGRGRPPKYVTDDERISARRKQQRERAQHAKQIVDAAMQVAGVDEHEQLLEWLKAQTTE